ncbi:MurR/RpiR family transcriptional regulator [Saccharibacillus kuerlensis]|uniref:RpiR family transcriptional regulator n=1 Tax=Saccharibacillus kuerlensis TaxID=459527 RepID=A0ABQ2L274_9BACL|nr:MurR/RpiR family transcriptional regulator [Saccharibacillus kuerlensis]GGO00130.1 RpiR family transcriptional regulator [Saccharibacillus kuerlensis]
MFSYDTIQRFNETEISIYKYIAANRDKVLFMTIRELAKETGVSTSTILRFCHKAACENYSEFKQQLKENLKETANLSPQSDLEALLHYFQGTNTSAFEAKIEQGAKILNEAEMILFVGLGSSGTLARYGSRYFSNLGKFSIGLEDPYYPVKDIGGKKAALIVLSVSGETKEIVDLMRNFQTGSGKILSVTSQPHSTISKMSDWSISYPLDMQRVNGGFNATSQVPVLFLMEVLARRM